MRMPCTRHAHTRTQRHVFKPLHILRAAVAAWDICCGSWCTPRRLVTQAWIGTNASTVPSWLGPSITTKGRPSTGARPQRSGSGVHETNGRGSGVGGGSRIDCRPPHNSNVLCSLGDRHAFRRGPTLEAPARAGLTHPTGICWGCLNPGRLWAVVGNNLRNLASYVSTHGVAIMVSSASAQGKRHRPSGNSSMRARLWNLVLRLATAL